MSPSDPRQSANAANAQLSTGPRTTDGKARSAQNARKHALTARDLVIGPEDRDEFEAFLAEYQTGLAPQGALQQTLFDQLVAVAWNLRRICRMETELCSGAATYQDLLDNDDLQAKLDRLARHHTRIERTFHRSLKELKALQTDAAIRLMIPRHVRKTASPLASANEIAKRTKHPPPYPCGWDSSAGIWDGPRPMQPPSTRAIN
jgi:hypothetical protein